MTVIHIPAAFGPKMQDPREQAVMREDVCAACGCARDEHWSIDGNHIGCDGALEYRRLPPRNPQRWNDPRLPVTLAVRTALLTKGGPALKELLDTLGHDLTLAIAHEAGEAAIAAYTRSLGQ